MKGRGQSTVLKKFSVSTNNMSKVIIIGGGDEAPKTKKGFNLNNAW